MPYTLITVTYGGRVEHTRGFETLRMCQEARSITLTGMTIAGSEAAERHRRRFEELRQLRVNEQIEAAWRQLHPPRGPTSAERRDMRRLVLAWSAAPGPNEFITLPDRTVTMRLSRSTLGADGLIYDWPHMVRWAISGSIAFETLIRLGPAPGDIKSAHCVIEVSDVLSVEALTCRRLSV